MAATGIHLEDFPAPTFSNTRTGYTPSALDESTEHLVSHAAPVDGQQGVQNDLADAKPTVTRKIHLSLLECLLHLVSIAFTIAVLYLSGAEVYFLDITKPNVNSILNIFQFVAALHAIIISISMGAMAVYHLQYELCAAEGLPFGYILGPFQLNSLELLFKPRFWKAALTRTNTARMYIFGMGIFVLTVLQALLAPSSAILLVPQLDWWKVDQPFGETNGFTYINSSRSSLWPTYVNSSTVPKDCDGGNLVDIPKYCPYAAVAPITDWGGENLDQFSPPNITISTYANMVRYLSSSDYNHGRYGYCAATTGTNLITRALGELWVYAQRHGRVAMRHFGKPTIIMSTQDYTQPVRRPLVQAQCAPPQDITDAQDLYEASFPLVTPPGELYPQNISKEVNISISRTFSPAVNFIDLSEAAGTPLLGALVGMEFFNAKDFSFDHVNASGLITCTFAAHWIPTNMSTEPKVDNVAILDHPNPLAVVASEELMLQATPIDMNVSYAERVNVRLSGLGINALENELRAFALRVSPKHQYDAGWGTRWPWVAGSLLSMQLSDALARIQARTPIMTVCEHCAGKISYVQDLTRQNSFKGGTRYNVSTNAKVDEIKSRPDLYTPVQWRVYRYGYGWGLSRVTEWLAAVALSLHIVLVLAHLCFLLVRRWHFDGWDGLLGFMALVNRSPPLAMLEDLAIGEADNQIYENRVVIRESEDGSRAVFTSSRDGKKLAPGREYS